MTDRTLSNWERQLGESSQAYGAFVIYRNFGAERSLQKVSKRLSKSMTLIKRWSSEWNWVARSRDWDNHIDQQAKDEAVKSVKKMTQRHINIAMRLQKKALEGLAVLDVSSMRPKEILDFVKEAAALERLNRMGQAEIDLNSRRTIKDSNQSNSVADIIISAYMCRKERGDERD